MDVITKSNQQNSIKTPIKSTTPSKHSDKAEKTKQQRDEIKFSSVHDPIQFARIYKFIDVRQQKTVTGGRRNELTPPLPPPRISLLSEDGIFSVCV